MKKRLKFIIILTAILTIILNIIMKNYPQFIEKNYSSTVNKLVVQGISRVTGTVSFSVAEFLVIALFLILAALIVLIIMKIKMGRFKEHILNITVYLSVLYIIFMFMWGFNYDRLSFDKIAGIKIEKSSKKELYNLCEDLIKRANALREKVKENPRGVMAIEGGYKDVLSRATKGYEQVSIKYPTLSGKYGNPKPILLSPKMSYTGITGIYIPYTGEANVNTNITDLMLPCTASHEMAHQRGFAREDEANYIAYLTCINHPDTDFQYSGVMLALIYSMNALADKDIEGYKTLTKAYSEGVRRDLRYENEFWSKYEGKVEEASNKVNDKYLKSNGQNDGVESYGRMVDLLLAEYKVKTK